MALSLDLTAGMARKLKDDAETYARLEGHARAERRYVIRTSGDDHGRSTVPTYSGSDHQFTADYFATSAAEWCGHWKACLNLASDLGLFVGGDDWPAYEWLTAIACQSHDSELARIEAAEADVAYADAAAYMDIVSQGT